MQNLAFQLFRLSMFLVGHMPFWMLYGLSDFLRFMLFYVIRYRKKVVLYNLQRCFPEKSSKEIHQIAWKFYRNLADITLESIKGFYLSKEEICRRWRVINPEALNEYLQNRRDVINLASHYANWEWGILALDAQIKHQAVSIYKPMSNRRMEEWSRAKRERFGMQLVPIWKTKEFFEASKPKPVSVVLAADQNPTNKEKAIVVKFFGHDTACLHGPEAFGRGAGIPLVYFDVQRVKRGFYTMEIIPLFDKPQTTVSTEITQVYMSQVEAVIRRKPEDYLWSHRRWKHSPEEINEMLARQNSARS